MDIFWGFAAIGLVLVAAAFLFGSTFIVRVMPLLFTLAAIAWFVLITYAALLVVADH